MVTNTQPIQPAQSHRVFTLVQRELQEYKNSLFWTPVAIALALTVIMLLSVLLANRISVMGDAIMQVILHEESASGMNIIIHIDDDDEVSYEYRVEQQEGPVDENDWNFSREWNFKPKVDTDSQEQAGMKVDSLNPMLNMLHSFMVMILVLVSVNYLLGSLYNDRKDRSILFWKSMPVSEWEEVLSKLAVALVVAPAIFIAVSILTQLACVVLAMLMVWRMDMDAFQLVLGNIDFVPLFLNQIGGWVLTALWVAPAYAWLLLASAAARRSPFMLAIAPVVGLMVIEGIFLGTEYVSSAVLAHLPHYIGGDSAVGFYFYGPDWSSLNFIGIALGLLFAAVAVGIAVYLRRYRFDI
jgi:hypothetical protein